jgi:hypothetical protein
MAGLPAMAATHQDEYDTESGDENYGEDYTHEVSLRQGHRVLVLMRQTKLPTNTGNRSINANPGVHINSFLKRVFYTYKTSLCALAFVCRRLCPRLPKANTNHQKSNPYWICSPVVASSTYALTRAIPTQSEYSSIASSACCLGASRLCSLLVHYNRLLSKSNSPLNFLPVSF